MESLARGGVRREVAGMWDKMKSTALRQGLNLMLSRDYGEVTELEFDTRERSVKMQLLLNGEASSIEVEVARFEPELEGEDLYLRLTGIRVSRSWLQQLARAGLEGKRFKVPSSLAGLAKLALS
jgi:hypothetical protein